MQSVKGIELIISYSISLKIPYWANHVSGAIIGTYGCNHPAVVPAVDGGLSEKSDPI